MPLTPGEVVMILDVEQDLDAQRTRNVRVNERVIRRGIPAHQLHRRPVLLARFSREIEPRQMRQFLRQLGMELARQPAVVLRDLRTRAAAAGVAEEREVLAAREPRRVVEHRELAELDEVIAAAARAELRPGAILQLRGHARHPPIGVHDVVLPARSERGADAETRLTLERAASDESDRPRAR